MEIRKVGGRNENDNVGEAFAVGFNILFTVSETEGGWGGGVAFQVEEVQSRMSNGWVTMDEEGLMDGVT